MTASFGPALSACPCGSGTAYAACCGPLHDGEPPATAEALMRSRYTAYACGRLDHLVRTWHPRTRPPDLTLAPGMTWLGLEVLGASRGGPDDVEGTVEFVARFRSAGRDQVQHETSRFERRAGRWVYVDGEPG